MTDVFDRLSAGYSLFKLENEKRNSYCEGPEDTGLNYTVLRLFLDRDQAEEYRAIIEKQTKLSLLVSKIDLDSVWDLIPALEKSSKKIYGVRMVVVICEFSKTKELQDCYQLYSSTELEN